MNYEEDLVIVEHKIDNLYPQYLAGSRFFNHQELLMLIMLRDYFKSKPTTMPVEEPLAVVVTTMPTQPKLRRKLKRKRRSNKPIMIPTSGV